MSTGVIIKITTEVTIKIISKTELNFNYNSGNP